MIYTSLNTSGNPDNNSWTAGFTYDNNGNVLTATDAKGTTITNAYDAMNRVTQRSYNDSPQTPTVNFYYDGAGLPSVPDFSKGKLTKVSSSVSESRYTEFDVAGRLLEYKQITDGQTYTSEYEYNLSGALVKETYPSGREVQNEFDASGDIERIFGKANQSAGERTYANSFAYNAAGMITQFKYGNGRWETSKHNSRLQVTEIGLGNSATNTGLWKTAYEYGELQTNGTVDAVKNSGNIARLTLTVPGTDFVQSFKYDSLLRLTEAVEKTGSTQNWIQQFGYDRYGNRTSFNQTIGSTTINTTPATDSNTNRFTSGDFGYDANGNIVEDIDTATELEREFIFNGDNKQVEVKRDGVTVGRYFYDGEGRRVKKVTDSEETIFVYSAGRLIAEYSTQISQTPTTSYLTNDHLGSPRIITDQYGQVTSRRDFMPFGEDIYVDVGTRTSTLQYGSSDDEVRQKFTGYEKDSETGLDFAEARMYANENGRFTAVDPLLASGKSDNPQSFNRYLYVMNNPLTFIDPDGLCTVPSGLQKGQVGICIEAFISTARVGPGGIAKGDGRSTQGDGNNPSLTNRLDIRMIFEASKDGVRLVGDPDVTANNSVFVFGGMTGDRDKTTGQSGEYVERELPLPGSHFAKWTYSREGPAEDFGTTNVTVSGIGPNGVATLGHQLQVSGNPITAGLGDALVAGAPGPIQYDLKLTIIGNGNVEVSGQTKGYPTYAAYAYTVNDDNTVTVKTLFVRPEKKLEDLEKPMTPIGP